MCLKVVCYNYISKGDDLMDNTNIVLAANIQRYRKKCGLTQEELAKNLGVTFQAVSKWENAKTAPDILFLPTMADLFGCYIDELFSREIKTEIHYDHCPEFPWYDDNIIRGVVCLGRKILQVTDGLTDKFTFEVIGDVTSVQSECNITVSGSVSGGCAADEIVVGGHVYGGCNAGDAITVGGNLSGGCVAGDGITCGGNLKGDITCGDTVTVTGNVESEKIKGNVICNSLECEKVEGDVAVKEGNRFDLCTELPFPDDTIMREVLCNGRKIIKVKPIG